MLKVINTRPSGQQQELSRLLKEAGYEPLEIPLVAITPSSEGLDKARTLSPEDYSGIFISSPNGLIYFSDGLPAELFQAWLKRPFYLVGGKVRPLIEKLGGSVAFVPQTASLEGFLREFPASIATPQERWLHPCSESTRLSPKDFLALGVHVDNLQLYRPECPPESVQRMQHEGVNAAAVIFCSGSAVDHFFQAGPDWASNLGKRMFAVSIGSSTTRALQNRGVEKIYEARYADSESLVDALKAALAGLPPHTFKK